MKSNCQYLTSKEFELMKIFWASRRPLSNKDIIELSDGRTWSINSLHPILNKLIKKGYIKVVGKIKATKVNARLFSPSINLENHMAWLVSGIISKNSDAFQSSKFITALESYVK